MTAAADVAVVGAGAWGTALAVHLARNGRSVRLWVREPELAERLRTRRDNPLYLPGVSIPEGVAIHGVLSDAVRDVSHVVTAVPSQHARGVYCDAAPVLAADVPVVVCTKGIEEGSLALPLEVARDELGERPFAVLSGPSFASEVARGMPTAVVVACADVACAARLQDLIASRELRVYTNDDPTGVQLAGAIKNVIAIAVGVADTLGLGSSARAALITRGLAEVTRLVVAEGGNEATTAGLAGLGDLVLTCTGDLSRNLTFGRRLGRGERTADIVRASRSVAEGVRTARAARDLARGAGVDMPIVDEVCRIVAEESSAQECLERLLSRPLRAEAPDAAS